METFSNLTGDLFGEPLTSLQADSLASRSVQPESERAEPMNDISFRKCFELFQRSDRVGSSLKTFAACLVSNLDQYSPKLSHRWKAKATRSLRFVFLLQPSKPRTGEIDCGSLQDELLPTLSCTTTASDVRSGTNLRTDNNLAEGGRHGVNLNHLIENFPMLRTPQASEATHGGPNARDSRGGLHLSAQIAQYPQLLNTPNVMDSLPVRSPEAMQRQMENNRPGRTQPPTLREQIAILPTPISGDWKGQKRKDGTASMLSGKIAMLRTPSANEPGVKAERLRTKDGEPATIGRWAYDAETGRNAQVGLSQQLAMLPTPATRDYKGAVDPKKTAEKLANGERAHMGALDNFVTYETSDSGASTGLKLQPAFVEWMMGYPIGYTDLKPSETA